MAERINGVAVGIEGLIEAIDESDVVLTSTGAGTPIVTAELMQRIPRRGRPLLFVDIAVPRDIAPGVAELADVTVLNLEDLSAWADRGRVQRLGEVDQVRQHHR